MKLDCPGKIIVLMSFLLKSVGRSKKLSHIGTVPAFTRSLGLESGSDRDNHRTPSGRLGGTFCLSEQADDVCEVRRFGFYIHTLYRDRDRPLSLYKYIIYILYMKYKYISHCFSA